MKKQKRNENGITLIALVISIIVMLILAGVSLNMTVGDNGIITQAQDATYRQSCAVLEEFLQQFYVENLSDLDNISNKAVALKNYPKSSSWFYQDAPLGYVVDKDGNAHYFINYSGLPEDIKLNIKGGNAKGKENLTYQDYIDMIDVYGVTSDLEVYYCSNGKESLSGIEVTELEIADSTQVIFPAGSNMAKLITQNNNTDVTLEDLKSVKTLTINSSGGISNLNDLYAFIGLKELTLDGVNFSNLNGIENASQLYSVTIINSTIEDYSKLSNLKDRLTYLYLTDTTDSEVNKLCNGIKSADFTKLQYFGIYDSGTKVTDISKLAELTTTTQNAIQYLYLYNNSISSVNSLTNFKNVTILKLENNSIKTLKGLENMSQLLKLDASDCKLGENEIYNTELTGLGKNENTDALASLKKCKNLISLQLPRNYNLKWVGYISELNNLGFLDLQYNQRITNESFVELKNIIFKLTSYNVRYEAKYEKLLNSSERQDLKGENLSNASAEWIALYNNTDIKQLRLDDNTDLEDIGEYSIENVLKTCTSLEVLSLENINISKIDFVKTMPNLKELDLVGTNVTDLSPLEGNCTGLKSLVFDKAGTDLTKIQNIISQMNLGLKSVSGTFFSNATSGINGMNLDALKSLEKCDKITKLVVAGRGVYTNLETCDLDLTKCTSLLNIHLDCTKMNLKLSGIFDSIYMSWRSANCNLDLSGCTTINMLSFYEISDSALQFAVSHFGNAYIKTLELNRCQDFNALQYISSTCTVTKITTSMNGTIYANSVIANADYITSVPGLEEINIIQHGSFAGFSSTTTLSSLKKITIKNSTVIDSIEFLKNSPLLTYVEISGGGQIKSFKGIENKTNITDLILTDNAISSVYEIANLTTLTKINLENNSIYDTTTYTNENDEKITVNNLEILANLNKNGNLRKLYLAGNTGITDWSYVSELKNWSGKSGW